MYNKEDSEIINYLFEKYPEEGCGLIINQKGKRVWIPCENTAENREETFIISSTDYLKASLKGDLIAIVHSHPDSSPEASEQDKKTSEFLGIPYIIYSLPEIEKYTYTPKYIRSPLLGREYTFGNNDCYSLVRDYYKQELNIELPTTIFEENWWNKGLDYFKDLYESFGFVQVDSPQKHDIIVFKMLAQVSNHCGIYLGEDIFLHHAVNRLSCRESVNSVWRKYIAGYYRCKQFT